MRKFVYFVLAFLAALPVLIVTFVYYLSLIPIRTWIILAALLILIAVIRSIVKKRRYAALKAYYD